MDQNEFDIYDDLFNNDEKKPEQVISYINSKFLKI